MRFLLILALSAGWLYTGIKLTQARHVINAERIAHAADIMAHQKTQEILNKTVETCTEIWLKTPVSELERDLIREKKTKKGQK